MAAPWNNHMNTNFNYQSPRRSRNDNQTEDRRHQYMSTNDMQNPRPMFPTPQNIPPRDAPSETHILSEQSNLMPPLNTAMGGQHQFRGPPPSFLSPQSQGNINYARMGQQSLQISTTHGYRHEPRSNVPVQQGFQQQSFQQPRFQENMNNASPRFGTPPSLMNVQFQHGNAPQQSIPNQPNVQNELQPQIEQFLHRKSEEVQAKAWVADWLRKRNKKKNTDKKTSSISICEAQELTRQMIVLLAKLQKHKQQLETMKLEDKSIWEQKHREVKKTKFEFDSLHNFLTNEETVTELKKKISQRQSKRRRIKRQKQEAYERRQAELVERDQKHKEIDRLIEQNKQKLEQKKQEEAMKKEADQILSEVRKKKSETNKYLQLIEGLQKLRQLRTIRLERQGVLGRFEGFVGGPSQRFANQVTDISQLLSKQLNTYNSEEDALKVLLETEHEETREKEREKLKQKQQEQHLKELKRQEKVLFGSQKEACPGDPIYPFTQYYTAAEHSLDALIQIRHDWDMYLVMPETPGSSQIPAGWVTPTDPASDTWSSSLKDQT